MIVIFLIIETKKLTSYEYVWIVVFNYNKDKDNLLKKKKTLYINYCYLFIDF